MNNQWIEIGTAMLLRDKITGMSEYNWDKYDEDWEFTVFMANSTRFQDCIEISNKDKDTLVEMHATLKAELKGE